MSDNALCLVLVLTQLAVIPVLVASPLFVWWARRKDEARRIDIARVFLCSGLLALWWLDAVVVVLAVGIADGSPLGWHLRTAAFLALVWLAVVPLGRGHRLWAAAGATSFFAFALTISFVPWNPEKICALDVWRISGEPLSTVQSVMGDYEASISSTDGKVHARVRDVDLAALDPTEIAFYPFGGCIVEVRDGRVGSIFFVYD